MRQPLPPVIKTKVELQQQHRGGNDDTALFLTSSLLWATLPSTIFFTFDTGAAQALMRLPKLFSLSTLGALSLTARLRFSPTIEFTSLPLSTSGAGLAPPKGPLPLFHFASLAFSAAGVRDP